MGTQAQAAPDERFIASVARHPILDRDEQVLGYELSFLQGPKGQSATPDIESETCTIIETLNVIGLGVLCDGHRAFIGCTYQMLMKEYFALLPPEVVVEIQESVPADEAAAAACRRLKQGGYMIALDNFVPTDTREPLVPFADFIKVDIKKVPPEQCAAMVARYASKQCRMLAHKVESRQDFMTAKNTGFTQFQGYFFRRTEHLRARHIPASQTTYLRLLKAISNSELDFTEIEDLIKHEPSLCYRLLRYLNSPLLGISSPVLSIRHGFNLLGEHELARWIRTACTLAMGQGKSSDLALSSMVRARFCELIAPKLKHCQSELYLMGLLSLMNAILEVPIGVVIEELPLDPAIKAQLLCEKTGKRTPLSPIYDLMVAREAGDWGTVTKLSKELNLSLVFVAASYNEAMRWAHQLTSVTRPQPSPGQ
jgi:EAL and modified HD-GYP domain-containing signal transduction protein